MRRLASGDLAEWVGLPPDCGPSALSQVFEGGEAAAQGILSNNRAYFRLYRRAGNEGMIQAWFDDEDHAFLITIVAPDIKGDVKELLERLGQPEKKLGPLVGHHADAHQWVYAGRGLTLYVREHLGEIARVAVYQPTDVEYYEMYLGATDQKRYRPRNRTR